MKIKILYFAQLREKFRRDEEELEFSETPTMDQILAKIFPENTEREKMRQFLRPALNCEYVSWERIVSDQDEVALIPPVAGG